MAEPIAFHYRAGETVWHRVDPRFKIIGLAAVSLCTLKAYPGGLLVLSLVLYVAMTHLKLTFRNILGDLRYFLYLLLVIMAARALLTPGSVLVPMVGLTVTAEGLAAGALIGWRLLAVVFLGLIFASTSRPKEIRAAVEKLLAPVPFIPEKQLATMLGLIVRFIPLVFDQAHETIDALKARGLENRKNPIYRLRRLGLPLLRRTILEADQLSLAMEARCFSFQRTVPRLVATGKDWLALLMVGAFCGLLIGSAVLQV